MQVLKCQWLPCGCSKLVFHTLAIRSGTRILDVLLHRCAVQQSLIMDAFCAARTTLPPNSASVEGLPRSEDNQTSLSLPNVVPHEAWDLITCWMCCPFQSSCILLSCRKAMVAAPRHKSTACATCCRLAGAAHLKLPAGPASYGHDMRMKPLPSSHLSSALCHAPVERNCRVRYRTVSYMHLVSEALGLCRESVLRSPSGGRYRLNFLLRTQSKK